MVDLIRPLTRSPTTIPSNRRRGAQSPRAGSPDSAARTSGSVRLSVMFVTAPAQSLGEIPSVGGMVRRT